MEGNQQNEENKEIQIDKKTEAAHLYHSIWNNPALWLQGLDTDIYSL
jgi:hypothetical protein